MFLLFCCPNYYPINSLINDIDDNNNSNDNNNNNTECLIWVVSISALRSKVEIPKRTPSWLMFVIFLSLSSIYTRNYYYYGSSALCWALAGDYPVARPLPIHRTTQTQNKPTQYRHPWLEWDSNPHLSVRESEDSSCLRPLVHCDRHILVVSKLNLDRFLPRYFQFIVHCVYCHSTLHILSCWKQKYNY
jgi:hypothetical protein